jgi:hypothetical protein
MTKTKKVTKRRKGQSAHISAVRVKPVVIFCGVCGQEKVKEFSGVYDQKTGEQVTRLVCPVAPCEHSGHDEIYSPKFWASSNFKCRRCLKRIPID